MSDVAQLWQTAQVAEPIGFDTAELTSSVGAFCLNIDKPTILSLNPAEDFELNTDIISSWKLVFQNGQGEIIGDVSYLAALQALANYVLDRQNGSILIRSLTSAEAQEVIASAIFA